MIDCRYLRLVLAALIGFAADAQNSTAPPKFYDLAGTVYDSVTNAPLAHALVQIPGRPNAAVFTSADGRFEIQHVAAGPVSFQAEKPGYFSPNSRPSYADNGRSPTDVRLRLIPEGHIEGRITNTDQDPITNLSVTVMTEQIVDGWKQQSDAGTASTNSAGRFRFDGLQPGRYYLRTTSRHMFQSAGEDSGVNLGYAPRYYPSAPDATWSGAMEVKAGETVEANIELAPARFYQVSGMVTGFSGDATFIQLGSEFGTAAVTGLDAKTGRFVLNDVFPGDWQLAARSQPQGPNGLGMHGEQSVRVTAADVADIRIDLHPDTNIPIEIDAPGPPPIEQNGTGILGIQLIATSSDRMGQGLPAEWEDSKAGQQGVFKNVPPGSYRVQIWPIGGMCVQSITAGNKDLTGGVLVVQESVPPQPLRVVLVAECAKITVKVIDEDGDAAGMLVLLPVSTPTATAQIMPFIRSPSTSQTLAPGDYKIFAISDLTGLEYANPQAMVNIPGQEIHLEANQTKNVDLELYRREQP